MRALLALAFALSCLGAHAQTTNYGGWDFDPPTEGFRLRYPHGTQIRSTSGDCLLQVYDRYEGSQWLVVNRLEGERRQITNELQIVHLDPQGRFMVQHNTGALNPCSGNNRVEVQDLGGGARRLNVSCSGNSLRGEGSGELQISADARGQITALRLDNKHGWYQSFYRGRVDCRF